VASEEHAADAGRSGRAGRGLHPCTSQLNLSRFSHKIYPIHPLILLKEPLNAPAIP